MLINSSPAYEAGVLCGRVVDRRDDPEGAFVERYFYADSTEVAGGLFGEIRERVLVEKHRVFVEPAHHAANAVVEQLSFGARFDIVVAHFGDDSASVRTSGGGALSRAFEQRAAGEADQRRRAERTSSGICQRRAACVVWNSDSSMSMTLHVSGISGATTT